MKISNGCRVAEKLSQMRNITENEKDKCIAVNNGNWINDRCEKWYKIVESCAKEGWKWLGERSDEMNVEESSEHQTEEDKAEYGGRRKERQWGA